MYFSGAVHTYPFLLENEYFFSGLAYRPLEFGENGHRKRIFSKTLSRVEIFENAGFSSTCGRTKTDNFEYDDVIHVHHILLAWRMFNKGCYRISIVLGFSCGRAKTTRIRYAWMRVFLKKEEKILVFKNIRIRVDEPHCTLPQGWLSAFKWHSVFMICFQFSLTPLHLACWYGQEAVVELLLERGASVNAVDRVSLPRDLCENTFTVNVPQKWTTVACRRIYRTSVWLALSVFWCQINRDSGGFYTIHSSPVKLP